MVIVISSLGKSSLNRVVTPAIAEPPTRYTCHRCLTSSPARSALCPIRWPDMRDSSPWANPGPRAAAWLTSGPWLVTDRAECFWGRLSVMVQIQSQWLLTWLWRVCRWRQGVRQVTLRRCLERVPKEASPVGRLMSILVRRTGIGCSSPLDPSGSSRLNCSHWSSVGTDCKTSVTSEIRPLLFGRKNFPFAESMSAFDLASLSPYTSDSIV